MISFRLEKIGGEKGIGGLSEAFWAGPFFDENKGQVLAVIDFAKVPKNELGFSAKAAFDLFTESYLSFEEGTSVAFDKAFRRMVDYLSVAKDFAVVSAVLFEDTLYVRRKGDSLAVLISQGETKEVLEQMEAHQGNIYIFGSSGFAKNFPKEKLSMALPSLVSQVAITKDKERVSAIVAVAAEKKGVRVEEGFLKRLFAKIRKR